MTIQPDAAPDLATAPTLDLDALDPSLVTFTLGGAKHPLRPPSTRLVKLFDRMATGDADEGAIDTLVAGLVPTLSESERGDLTMAQQTVIIGRGMAEAQAARQRVVDALNARAASAGPEGNAAAADDAAPASSTAPASPT